MLAAAGFAAARVYAPKALSGVAAPKPTSIYTVQWCDSEGYADSDLRAFFYGNTQTEQDFR